MKNDDLQHRKAKCRLRITDKQGQPISEKKLFLKQTNHEFLFGCGGFDVIPYCNNDKPENLAFLQSKVDKWLDIYNYATLPFYWGRYEPVEGQTQEESMMKTARFLQSKNIKVKGHPLCWHTVCADWLMEYDNKTILKKQLERINREVTGFKGVIDMWDVINEVVIMPIFDKYDNAITRVCRELGRVSMIKEVFKAAHDANPEAVLLLNDFNLSTSYEILIDGCLKAGVPISAIGIQSHQHQGYWGSEKVEAVLSRYEQFGLPIHFTENTLISGKLMPPDIIDLNDYQVDVWDTTPEFEERQKNQMEEMYRILFKHPLVQAVTCWDFTDGGWLKAPSGVIRSDGSAKPAYDMLKKLIKQEWHTEYEIHTDNNGFADVEGFKGEYALSMGNLSAAFKLESGCDIMQLVME